MRLLRGRTRGTEIDIVMEMDDFLVVLVVIRTGDGQFKTGARLEGVRYAPRVETAVRLP